VGAKDKASGKEQSIRIEGSGGLSEADIKRMVNEAEAHAAEDKGRREAIEKKNQLDTLIYGAEKMLRENADKLPADEKKGLEETLEQARKDLESDDAGRIDSARQRVEQATHKVAELLYKAQTAGGGAQAPGAGAKAEGDVIDAEYTEEKGGSTS
jgi:molecular chaperone DnaK